MSLLFSFLSLVLSMYVFIWMNGALYDERTYMNNPPYDPNDPYSQPTTAGSYPQPGQFGPPPVPPKPPKPPLFDFKARRAYYRQYPPSKKKQIAIGCGTLIGVLLLCGICIAISTASNSTRQPTTVKTSTPTATVAPTKVATPSPMPTKVVTPSPMPPTPVPVQSQPTQQPTAAPAPAQLFVSFTGASAVDNSSGSVSVHTLPGAALTISVKYCTGYYATSGSLKGTQYADGNGDYTWNWTPQTKCRGTATAYVTASLNGQSASNSTSFDVS